MAGSWAVRPGRQLTLAGPTLAGAGVLAIGLYPFFRLFGLVLAVGLVYVVWQYRRDCRSIAWPWAVALGTLRAAVYLILAGIFLLISPSYFRPMTEQLLGWIMLGVAGGMILMGNFVIRKMVRIDV